MINLNTPFLNADGRTVSREWLILISNLNSSISSLPTDLTALEAEINNAIALSNSQAIPPSDTAIQDLGRQLSDFLGQISDRPNSTDILRRLSDLESRMEDRINPILAAFPVLEPWTAPTLLNGWVDFGSGFNPTGFYKDPFGIVHLRGFLKSGTVGVAAFTLPAGYRPVNTESFSVSSNSAYGQVYVLATGDVELIVGSNAYFSLDGITFRAA